MSSSCPLEGRGDHDQADGWLSALLKSVNNNICDKPIKSALSQPYLRRYSTGNYAWSTLRHSSSQKTLLYLLSSLHTTLP